MPAGISTTREARWLGSRLRTLDPALPIFQGAGRRTKRVNGVDVPVGRQIVYLRQGGADIVNQAGTYLVRSAWLVYVSEPVASGATVYVEDLEADADRMHDAIYKPSVPTAINGRYIEECRRDVEHYLPVYDGSTLTEVQLGATYIIYTSKA